VHDELQELVENPGETGDVLRLGLYCLASYDGATELERGLGILLTGLATTLIPGDVMPPQPIPPPGHSSAGGI
jgi:hypothetical protein